MDLRRRNCFFDFSKCNGEHRVLKSDNRYHNPPWPVMGTRATGSSPSSTCSRKTFRRMCLGCKQSVQRHTHTHTRAHTHVRTRTHTHTHMQTRREIPQQLSAHKHQTADSLEHSSPATVGREEFRPSIRRFSSQSPHQSSTTTAQLIPEQLQTWTSENDESWPRTACLSCAKFHNILQHALNI